MYIYALGLCRINVAFVDKDGEETHIKVPVGMSMLEAAHENDIDLEGELTIMGCFYFVAHAVF